MDVHLLTVLCLNIRHLIYSSQIVTYPRSDEVFYTISISLRGRRFGDPIELLWMEVFFAVETH